MSKKTFSAVPKPKQLTDDQILAFEKSGAGHDTTIHAKHKYYTPTKRLSLDLPESTHTRFKTACCGTSRKMVVEIKLFIERRIIELEEEAGITHK